MKFKTSNLKQKNTKPISKVGLIDHNVQFEINGNALNKSPESHLNKQKLSYSGGFKIPIEILKKQTPNVISNAHEKQRVQAKQQILKQFGVLKNENEVKINKYLPKTKDQLASKVIETIQQKIDRIRIEREKIFNNQIKNINFNSNFNQNKNNYILNISEPNKMVATHVHSSLEYLDLDNISALHEAHKKDLKPIQQEYMKKKGHLIKVPQLTKQKDQYDQQQQKIKKEMIYKIMKNEEQKKGDKKTKQEQQQEQLNRLFEEKKRLDPKLAEYDLKYREYMLEKKSKQIIKIKQRSNLFKWDKYKQPSPGKKKSKQSKQIAKLQQKKDEQQINIKIQKEQKEQDEENMKNLSIKYDLANILITKNDKFIMKYIFKQLDIEKKGLISKTQFFDYCIANQLIKKEYNINQKWFYSDLDSFQTIRKGILNYQQCENFLSLNRNLKHPDIIMTEITKDLPSAKSSLNKSKLNRYELDHFQKVFKELDVNDDKIVKREQLLQNLYLDPFIIKILDMPAIFMEIIQKTISVRQILSIILRQYTTEKNQKKKKAKEYITLNQFLDYFNQWDSLDLTVLNRGDKDTKSNQITIFDIESQYIQLLQDIFNSIPRIYQNYICVKDFFEYCRKDPQIISISDQLCRIQSVQTKLKLQTLKNTLERMHIQCQEYECWDNLKAYFSRRGRPLDWDENKLKLKKELREKEKNEFLKKMANTKKSLEKKQKQKIEAFKDNKNYKKENLNNKVLEKAYNYTIPLPFSITDELKEKNTVISNQKAIEYKEEYQELKNKIKAIPLNKQILQPKLNKIQEQRKLKSQKYRQESKNQIKNIEKPFSFYEKELIAKTLKEAALKYQKQELMQLKLNTIKAQQIQIDLKKPYKQVIEEYQQKNKKQIEKKKPVQVSKSLYPDNPKELEKEKRKNLQEKLNRLEQIDKKKKEQLERIRDQKAQKNKKKNNILIQKKKRQEQQQVQRLKIKKKLADISFQPKINNNYVPQKKQDIQSRKKELQDQKIEQFIKQKQEKRKKILEFQPKQEPKMNISSMSVDQILQKLSDISFEDLIEEQGDKSEYLKQKQFQKIPFSNRKKIKKDRANAMMQRQRLDMQTQEKRRREELRQKQMEKKEKKQKNKEKEITGQLQRTQGKKIDPQDKQFEKNFTFHKSKALRRYRDIMEGKKPLSQYDRMSNQNVRSQTNKQQKPEQIFEDQQEIFDQEQQSGR